MTNDTINIPVNPLKIFPHYQISAFSTFQPHIIQGHFTDFVTSSHCLNSALFSELCLFYLFTFFTALKAAGMKSMVALYFLKYMVLGFVKVGVFKYLLLCIFHYQMKDREQLQG